MSVLNAMTTNGTFAIAIAASTASVALSFAADAAARDRAAATAVQRLRHAEAFHSVHAVMYGLIHPDDGFHLERTVGMRVGG